MTWNYWQYRVWSNINGQVLRHLNTILWRNISLSVYHDPASRSRNSWKAGCTPIIDIRQGQKSQMVSVKYSSSYRRFSDLQFIVSSFHLHLFDPHQRHSSSEWQVDDAYCSRYESDDYLLYAMLRLITCSVTVIAFQLANALYTVYVCCLL